MERIITQRKFRKNAARIVRALHSGDSFTITRNGVPIGRMTPIERRTFVPTAELKESAANLGKIDFKKFRADIDAHIDQDATL